MEALKLPVREIESKYTTSEIIIMGWQSKLQNYNMSKKFNSSTKALPESSGKVVDINYNRNPNNVRDIGDAWQLPGNINNGVPIPKKFFDEEGNFDLRRASGPEALAYLRKIGVNLTIPVTMR